MFILSVMLFMSWWTSTNTDPLTFDNILSYYPPPYSQSYMEFSQASRYLLQRLPLEDRPIENYEARKNYGFGIIVGLAKELAYAIRPQHPPQRYQPLNILSDYIPHAWDKYNYIVNETKSLLMKADTKIEPVMKIINVTCFSLDDITCDRKLQVVIKTARYLQPRADLLLQLGSVSNKINGFSNTFDSISMDSQEIPFLKHHTADPYVRSLMKALYKTYSLIKNIN